MEQTAEKTVEWVLRQIASDMQEDAARFDGKPFNGRTVAEYFGNQGAAIAALAGICAEQQKQIDTLIRAGRAVNIDDAGALHA